MKTISVARLRELLDYNPETGIFTWKTRAANRIQVGDIAGAPHSRGYLRIKIEGKDYFAHRLAFAHIDGVFPPEQVDHINGIRHDNRFCNLRHATNAENSQNTKRRPNNSGATGVVRYNKSGKWTASIWEGGKRVHLGLFKTIMEASAAYLAAKAQIHTFQPRPR